MADYKNIPLGLRTQTQIPLDVKEYIQNESLLSNLGVNGQLAYTYTKGLVVYCIEESTRWEWTEVKPGLEDTGLINQDFIYSDNHIAFGIDYSNKRYNFFPYGQSTFTVPDATTTIKGILKLANDLGGTADLPTTPTAIHKTGNENFTGVKTSTNTGIVQNAGIALYNDGGNNSSRVFTIENNNSGFGSYITNKSTGIGAIVYNQSSGTSFFSYNTGSGPGIESYIGNLSSGSAFVAKGELTSGGFLFLGTHSADYTPIYSVDVLGNIVANSYIKTGGTSTQLLKADGNVIELNPQKSTVVIANYTLTDTDNGTTIFVDTTSTAITITVGSITKAGFCVGFIHKAGSNDITFSGVTNPIGLKSKGQGYQTFIERELATSTYYLLGNVKS